MITCPELAELLLDFEAGELPTDHREDVEHHLRHCSWCVAYLQSYRLTVQLPHQLPRPPLPSELWTRLRVILAENCI